MIAITFQIDTSPSNGAISVGAAIDSREATAMEEKIAVVCNAAVQAAFQILAQQSAKPANLLVSGAPIVAELVKARMEAGGVQFDGTPIDIATRKRNQGQG